MPPLIFACAEPCKRAQVWPVSLIETTNFQRFEKYNYILSCGCIVSHSYLQKDQPHRQPVKFNAFHAENKKPMHRECGFIRIQPGGNRVAFIIAQNSGLVEIEEGDLTGQQLTLHTHALARTSFAKEPHVQQISRVFQLRPDGKLEQTVSMAMEGGPLMQHLHITYRRSS
uniref:THAP4-like heme-binding domain-containing protein n=1 Tax=Oncorhynchus tshawytscha TaxID=74940 RepID=A0A8C8J8U8_ONCTS